MDYWSLLGGERAKSAPPSITDVIDSVLSPYWNQIDLCVVEPLEIYKLDRGQYHVLVKGNLADDQCDSAGKSFINMVHELFTGTNASISRSRLLYFGESHNEAHQIFSSCDPFNYPYPKLNANPRWVTAQTEPLRWSYADLLDSELSAVEEKFSLYRKAQIERWLPGVWGIDENGSNGFLYNLLIPAAFQGDLKHERARRALGAVFIVIVSRNKIDQQVVESLFLRVSLFMYYYHSAEAIDSLIIQTGMDRYQKMLLMLQAPLNNLTSSLQEMERDAQELRAVLYEPVRGLLAARRRIAEYFRGGEWLSTPGGGFVIAHKPADIADLAQAQWTLAHLLAGVRGDRPRLVSAKESLAYEVAFFSAALEDEKHQFHEFSHAVNRLGDCGINRMVRNGMAALDNLAELVGFISAFKLNLFTILKPDYSWPLTTGHLHSLISAPLPTGRDADNARTTCIVSLHNTPFVSYAHFIEFLGLMFSQHSDCKARGMSSFEVDCIGCEGCCSRSHGGVISTTFKAHASPWIVPDELSNVVDLLQQMNRAKAQTTPFLSGDFSDRQYGDFVSCFSYLFRRSITPAESINGIEGGVRISWKMFELEFNETRFTISSGSK